MEIYYEGNLDYIATYKSKAREKFESSKPRVMELSSNFYDKLNFFFANSRWPKRGEV